MLEPPPVSHTDIVACLRSDFGLDRLSLEFLPLGADLDTAVYRASVAGGPTYFAKLRFGAFDEMSALLPSWLAEQGIAEVMAPVPACSGRPWAETAGFRLLLYPFVEGTDAYGAVLSDSQWRAFGRAIRSIHDAPLPPAFAQSLRSESYSSEWRDQLRESMLQLGETPYPDAPARSLGLVLEGRRAEVRDLIARTQRLARELADGSSPNVLCHTDLHAGNLLLAANGRLFIVDWDAPLLAPPERDLMYPGGGQGFLGRSADAEEALFYAGYGPVDINLRALAYYRLERIMEDLAIYCGQLFCPEGGLEDGERADREQAARWATSNFEPGAALEIALRTAERAEVS